MKRNNQVAGKSKIKSKKRLTSDGTAKSIEDRLKLIRDIRIRAINQRQLQDVETKLHDILDHIKRFNELENGAVHEVLNFLSLFLCQEGRDDEAELHLKNMGMKYRLSSEVLNYKFPDGKCNIDMSESADFVNIVKSALPINILKLLQEVFGPDAAFWGEHGYSKPSTGYFSYVHCLDGEATTGMDQIVRHIKSIVAKWNPKVNDAHYAEWWAHCRPHSSGHQLHFDSDNEGLGFVRNPIFSTVLYLHENECVGGPTLVTNQLMGGSLASKGWLVFPKFNSMVAFDGTVLHGVIPGRSFTENSSDRRITLMVAFWKSISIRERAEKCIGASMPFPNIDHSQFTWHNVLVPLVEINDDIDVKLNEFPASLKKVWDRIGTDVPLVEDLTEPPHYNSCFQGF